MLKVLNLLKVLMLLVIFSSSVTAVNSNTIDSYDGQYTIIEDKVIVEETIIFPAMTSEFSLLLPSDAQAVEVKGINFKLTEFDNFQQLTLSGKPFDTFTLKYITESLLERTADNFFILDLGQLEAEKIDIKVILPERATLKYSLDSPQPSIMPKTDQVLTDGKSIIIKWDETNLKINKAVMVIYDEKKNINSYLLFSLIIIVIISAGLLYWRLKWGEKRLSKLTPESNAESSSAEENLSGSKQENKKLRQENQKEGINAESENEKFKKELTRNLFEEERAIMEILVDAENNELWQKQLVLKTGISKVKLSRKLRNLEAKGLIEKVPYGNTNKIRLKETHS